MLGWALPLAACAAKTVTPVAMSQPDDEQLSCAQLQQQLADNGQTETKLNGEDKKVAQANIAKNVLAATPYVGILFAASTDLSNSEQVRARALADRNQELQFLLKKKGCAQ
jgi:hypothetical protein